MTQKRTGRRASGRQANIVGTASVSSAGFGGLNGVAGNTGVTLTKTTSPVSPAGLSTVGGGLQVSGSTKVATPVVIGGGSSGSGGSSSGSGTGGSGIVAKPIETPRAPVNPTIPTTVVPKPTTPTGGRVVSGGSSGGSSSGGSVVTKPVVTQPTTPAGGGFNGSIGGSVVVKPVETPRAPVNPTIPITVVPKPTVPTGGGSSGGSSSGGSSGSGVVALPVEEISGPMPNRNPPTMVIPSPTAPTDGTGSEGKETITAPAGFGDRFVLNPAVEEKIEFNEDVEEMKTNESVTTPGFGGIEGLVNRPELEDSLKPFPGEVGLGDAVRTDPEPADDNLEIPATETSAKSGSGKKWLWLIVAAVALWFVFKKK